MSYLHDLVEFYRTRIERRRQHALLRGSMAACALVATVEGEVRFSYRMRLDQIFAALERLRVFDPHEGVDLFDRYAKAILVHPANGRRAAIAVLKEAAEEHEDAELLIRIALALSEADGEISLAEQIEIVTLCSILEVHPDDCGLYTDTHATGVLAEFLEAEARRDSGDT